MWRVGLIAPGRNEGNQVGKRIWVSGYRAWELNVYGDQDPKLAVIKYVLKAQLRQELDADMDWLITGGELGVEQWAASVGLSLKSDYPELQIAMMTPYADFGHQWQENNQATLATLQQQVDFARSTSTRPYESGRQLGAYNRFMAQHTDGAVFVYDPEFVGKPQYAWAAANAEANRREYPVRNVSMLDLEDAARDYAEQQRDE